MGAYQILYLDKVPDYAAVNQSVELARLFKRGSAAGLVNAVLRKVSQNKHALPPIPEGDILRTLSIRYSHPRWLIKRLLPVLGPEETEEYLRINNSVAPMTVQVNTMKTTPQALRTMLEGAGIGSPGTPLGPRLPGAVRHRRSHRAARFPGRTFPGAGSSRQFGVPCRAGDARASGSWICARRRAESLSPPPLPWAM